jgi:hypothetical protein
MWRRLVNWHEDDWLAARLSEPAGQVLLLAAAALLLPSRDRVAIVVAVALTMVFPARRIEVLAVGSLWILYQRLPDAVRAAGPLAVAIGAGAALVLLAACLAAARRFDTLPPVARRHPIALLHGLLLGALAISTVLAVRGSGGVLIGAAFTTLAALIPFLLWRASYLMLSGRRGTAAPSRTADHLFYWFPLWGGTATPYGKGFDHLRQHAAGEPLALARSRAAGLKLLLLALVWSWVASGFDVLGSRSGFTLPSWLGGFTVMVPPLGAAIATGPDAFGFATRWLIILLDLFRSVVALAASGHLIVGVLRLCGFNVFRNTYKPLLAPTILEFWNRYYYYFKELMVEFFFYPTFLSLSKQRAVIRIVLSVLAAATLGNLYYHLISDHLAFARAGLDDGLQHVAGRAIYSVILGTGVAVSMLRERRARGGDAVDRRWATLRTVRAVLGVWLFYGLLHIWNVGRHFLDLEQRTIFLLSLFGL